MKTLPALCLGIVLLVGCGGVLETHFDEQTARERRTANRLEDPEIHHRLARLRELGNPYHMLSLGDHYYSGDGVAQDYTEAVKWYRKAAEQGNAEAQNNLGICYANGRGVAKDYTEAVKWHRKAAEGGHGHAEFNLVMIFSPDAVKWWRKAAEQGNAEAQNNLGICYAHGRGVAKDYTEAAKWFRKAVEGGLAEANIAWDICGTTTGEGVAEDGREGALDRALKSRIRPWRKAAE